ncbi:MAG: hypothetical protein HYX29_05665 [Solirubrobacterales bacterium]|nr:hypothetical protein [Solirubrobacterales bacterium]
MRLQLTTIAALVASTALTTGLAGCGGSNDDLPVRTISFQGPTSGPLKQRASDMRKAAELAVGAIDGDTKGSRLKIVDGPDPNAIATIDALASVPISGKNQLSIALTPPIARETRLQRRPAPPRIWLLPPDALGTAAKSSYMASGVEGATKAASDSPLRAGTPSGQYVTPGLSADNYPPSGTEFFKKFNDAYNGTTPDRYAIYGYEAVGLIVDALTRLEEGGTPVTQSSVAETALAIRDRFSPVGRYDVLPSGQTTLYVFQARGRGAPPGDAALIEALR